MIKRVKKNKTIRSVKKNSSRKKSNSKGTASHAKKFSSILVHFGKDKAHYHPTHLHMSHSMITVPTAWKFKVLTEVGLDVEIPGKKGKKIKCHGIIIDSRPIKGSKGHYQTDLLLADIPRQYEKEFKQLVPLKAKLN